MSTYEIEIVDDSLIPDEDKKKKTSNLITKFEYTKIISFRARQISEEIDHPRVNVHDVHDPLELAKLELHRRVSPVLIKRTFPNGSSEFWDPAKMIISDY